MIIKIKSKTFSFGAALFNVQFYIRIVIFWVTSLSMSQLQPSLKPYINSINNVILTGGF